MTTPRIAFFQFLRVGSAFLKLALVIILLGGAGGGLLMAYKKLFVQNDEFALRDIPLLKLGTDEPPQFLDHKRVIETTGIDLSSSIFAIDCETVEQKINDLPEIASAKVSRRFPGTIKIEVTEHVPVAWIECETIGLEGRNPRSGYLVNLDGVVFPCSTSALWIYAENLPVIALPRSALRDQLDLDEPTTNASLDRVQKQTGHRSFKFALELARHATTHLSQSAAADRIEVRDEITIELVTRDGSQGIFSYFDQERQLSDFAKLIQHAKTTGRTVGTANLIPTRNIPVTYVGTH